MKLTDNLKKLGHTCRSLEKLTGIPYTTVWRHLSGTSPMPLSAALKYESALGIPIAELASLAAKNNEKQSNSGAPSNPR